MTVRIALDASVLVGLLDSKDAWHARASSLYTSIKSIAAEEIIFDCALTEAISAIGRRLHEKRRVGDWGSIIEKFLTDYPPDRLTWILPDVPQLYMQAIGMMRSTGGQLNFNDALIAIACREREILVLASFDPDFDQVPW